jgi:hypothetical protein
VQAALVLGITRGSLRNKIRTLGIGIGRTIWSEDDQPDSRAASGPKPFTAENAEDAEEDREGT